MAAVSGPLDRPRRSRLSIPIIPLPMASTAKPVSPLFSPVNELGSFEFDRVLKSGSLLKRRKRTNAWDTVRLVLRPNLLSIYKDEQETRLKHQVNMSEITAVALRKDRKRKGDHDGVFGLFSPSRNFHLEADTEKEAQEWVDILRREARIDQDEEEVTIGSPRQPTFGDFARMSHSAGRSSMASGAFSATSSDTVDAIRQSSSTPRFGDPDHALPHRLQRNTDVANLSSSEMGSFSDVSETPAFGSMRNMSFSSRYTPHGQGDSSRSGSVLQIADLAEASAPSSQLDRKAFYSVESAVKDDERVLWHGYLQCLKNNRGVRQWKRYWVVLRAKHLALYKSEEEYAALLILPLATILDAVETDPVAKGKDSCMQIITDDRSYRFCCANEEDLSRWLGALKSTLALRKKKEGMIRPK